MSEVTFEVDDDVYERLLRIAETRGTTVAEIILDRLKAIAMWIEPPGGNARENDDEP